jgi:hypothetical protein
LAKAVAKVELVEERLVTNVDQRQDRILVAPVGKRLLQIIKIASDIGDDQPDLFARWLTLDH